MRQFWNSPSSVTSLNSKNGKIESVADISQSWVKGLQTMKSDGMNYRTPYSRLNYGKKTFKLLILLMFISNCKSITEIDEVYHESILECYDDWNMYYLPRDSMLISCLYYRQAFKERGYNPSLIIGVNENDTIGFYTQDSLGNCLCEGNKLWIYKDDSEYWTKYFLPLEETELHFPNRIMPIIYGKSETNYLICAVERIYFCKLKRLQGLKQSQ